MEDPFKMWSAVQTYYFANNEVILWTRKQSSSEAHQVAGLQARIIHEHAPEVVEKVGRPEEVFVSAPRIADLVGCSISTARNWLSRFQAHGLLDQHGDIDVDGQASDLYLPAEKSGKAVFTVLHDLGGEDPPGTLLQLDETTPSDFVATSEEGVFKHIDDSSLTVDVREPSDGQSIREYVRAQLRKAGLRASSPHNFEYQLRKRAGLISKEQMASNSTGGNPEPFQAGICFVDLNEGAETETIRETSQADAMAGTVEYLIDEGGFLNSNNLPWLPSPGRGKRAIVNDEPRHVNGEPMGEGDFQPIRGGYYVYTKLKSQDKRKYIGMMAKDCGFDAEFRGAW